MNTHRFDTQWLDAHRGETVLVKFGGNAMVDPALGATFAEDVVALQRAGLKPVVTHGGGPQISAELARQGIASEFRGGLRYTTPEAVLVVRRVLVELGRGLAARIQAAGGVAEPIAGDERNVYSGILRGTVVLGEPVDLGRVGEVVAVDATAVADALDAGRIPVVSAIAPERGGGGLLNVNADSAAASLAAALGADWLVILTDVPGLYRDWPNRDSLVTRIDTQELASLLPDLEAGMIPKMTACLAAVDGGVAHAAIIDGRVPHALLNEPFGISGTTIVASERATHE